jgi:hypothetical protein
MLIIYSKDVAENESEPVETTTEEKEGENKKASDEENKTNQGMKLKTNKFFLNSLDFHKLS